MSRPTVAVVGASADRRKFGNKAVRAFRNAGYDVYPINPKAGEIEGLKAYASLDEPARRAARLGDDLRPARNRALRARPGGEPSSRARSGSTRGRRLARSSPGPRPSGCTRSRHAASSASASGPSGSEQTASIPPVLTGALRLPRRPCREGRRRTAQVRPEHHQDHQRQVEQDERPAPPRVPELAGDQQRGGEWRSARPGSSRRARRWSRRHRAR